MNRISSLWARIVKQNLLPLKQVWAGQFPVEKPRPHSLIEKLVITPILLIRSLSLTNLGAFFSPGGGSMLLFIDLVELAWLGLLSFFLFGGCEAQWLVVALSVYRISEIVTYHFAVLLVDSQSESYRLISLRRSFVFAIVHFYEIIAAYAVIYLLAGNIASCVTGEVLSSGTGALYYSVVTMATLGYGDFCPADDASRAIVVLQLLTAMLFLVGIVPVLAANIAPFLAGQSNRNQPDRRS